MSLSDKERYIENSTFERLLVAGPILSFGGAVIFLVLSGLDYVTFPEHFSDFLRYRMVITAGLLGIGVLVHTGRFRSKQAFHVLLFVGLIGSAATVELMVLQTGGASSPYYVGIGLVGIWGISFLTVGLWPALVYALAIYAVYLVPILALRTITDVRFFFMANAFLLALLSSSFVLRHFHFMRMRSELGLTFELERQRRLLEQQVRERTATLSQAVEDLQREIREREKAEEAQRKLQAHLLQMQKMDSIGRLAGGIAHDFNNILSAISAASFVARTKLANDHPAAGDLAVIHSAAERAAGLTRQLLAFSRQQKLEMRVIDLNAVVESAVQLTARLLGGNIELTLYLHRPLGMILADAGQIEQVLMNLMVNARDAMPQGGRLLIATEETDVDAPVEGSGGPAVPSVALVVKDAGSGMSREVQERMFEPFFTTKEEGKGTGLGLSMVYGIVKQHNGHIRVSSAEGAGTTITISFPTADRGS